MANDREFIIQPLITEKKVVKLSDIDPTTTYAQIGVWQANQQQAGSPGNSYPSYVIPLSELLGGPTPVHMQNYLLVDSKFGNDGTAVKNNDLLPYRTIDAAVNAAQPEDVIIMNPGSYFSSKNIMSVSAIYYCRPGVNWVIFSCDSPVAGVPLRIYGHGNINFGPAICGVQGAHDQDITIEAEVVTLPFYWFLDNGPYLSTATEPLTFKLKAKTVNANGAIGILYSLPWQLQIDIDTYNSFIFFAGADYWAIQDFQNPAGTGVPTKNVININRANLFRDSVPFLSLPYGRNINETYLNTNMIFRNSGGNAPFVIRLDATCGQTVFVNGVYDLQNVAMVYDQSGGGSQRPRIQIKGKIYNTDTAASVLFTTFYISDDALIEIAADVIVNSANNPIINMFNTGQVDITSAKLINTDVSGVAPALILKSGGVLRLFNAKLISGGGVSIQGGAPGEPMEVYTAFANVAPVNMVNTLIGTALIVDPLITDNNF